MQKPILENTTIKCIEPTGYEKVAMSNRTYNRVIERHGSWVVIDVSTKSRPNKTSKMDTVDFIALNAIGRIGTCAGGYSTMTIKSKYHYVHRIILFGAPEVDHINGDRSDNRSSNLRSVTKTQNNMNRKVTNSSGANGVSYSKQAKKWRAEITFDNKTIFLGGFVDRIDAVNARLVAQEKYFGEYARKEQK